MNHINLEVLSLSEKKRKEFYSLKSCVLNSYVPEDRHPSGVKLLVAHNELDSCIYLLPGSTCWLSTLGAIVFFFFQSLIWWLLSDRFCW